MGTPLVSVVIPVFNIEAHLRQCLDSVRDQTLRELEIICVDDGSTDSSPQILAGYARQDDRFRVITQSNAGPGVARNTGMAEARGEYLIFLDADDWFEPGFLEKMAAKAHESEAEITLCRAVEFDTNTGRELPSEWMLKERYLPGDVFSPQEVAEHIFQFTYGMPWDKLYARNFIMESGICYPPLKNSEDLAFVFPTLLAASQIAIIDEVLIHHRVNRNGSVSNSRTLQPEAPYQAFQIVKRYLETRGLMQIYERSFLNWAMEFLVWHVANMGDPGIQRQYFDVLRKKWLPEMKFEAHKADYYEDHFTYYKYLLAKYAPWPMFSVVLKGYQRLKRRKSSER